MHTDINCNNQLPDVMLPRNPKDPMFFRLILNNKYLQLSIKR